MNKQQLKTIGISILQVVVIFAFIATLTKIFVYATTTDGLSMAYSIQDRDVLYGIRYNSIPMDIERGHVVSFEKYIDYEGEKVGMIKRVIAIPGDNIKVLGNDVYLNGEYLNEDYIAEPMDFSFGDMEYTLREGEYFVMGDNRNYSGDSREFGLMYEDEVSAILFFRLYNDKEPGFQFKLLKE